MALIKVDVEESLVETARTLIGATAKWETVESALRRIVGQAGRDQRPPSPRTSAKTREDAEARERR